MKKLPLLLSAIALTIACNTVAKPDVTFEELLASHPTDVILLTIKKTADEIGIAPLPYMAAARRFEHLSSKISHGMIDIEGVDQSPEFAAVLPYVQAGLEVPKALNDKLLHVTNLRQAQMASRLGLEVNDVQPFLRIYASKRYETMKSLKINETVGEDGNNIDVERIKVVCPANSCGGGRSPGLTIRHFISYTAREAGIAQLARFAVDFEGTAGDVHTTEIWKYSNTAGAWKAIPQNCADCFSSE